MARGTVVTLSALTSDVRDRPFAAAGSIRTRKSGASISSEVSRQTVTLSR
jgi:hypothetical protein